jgi:hypothetical protein
MVKDTDDKALSKFSFLLLISFSVFTGLFLYRLVLIPASLDLCTELFPDSQIRTEAAVAKSRVEEVVDANAPWTTKDRLVAMFSRISHMRVVDRTVAQLPEAAIAAFKSLWPDEPIPDNTNLVAKRLQGTDWRLSEWHHSAARAGADIALRFACSWYEGLDLDALYSMRDDAPTNKDPVNDAARCARAYQGTIYATPSTFIPPPANLKEVFSDDEEEDDDEETREGEAEAEAEASEEPAAGTPELAPAAPEVPEVPATHASAPESSSPLY